MVNASQIVEHMEVIGSDGKHVGTVDKLVLKLTKSDPSAHGQHHILSLDAIDQVKDGKLVLNLSADEAIQKEKAVA